MVRYLVGLESRFDPVALRPYDRQTWCVTHSAPRTTGLIWLLSGWSRACRCRDWRASCGGANEIGTAPSLFDTGRVDCGRAPRNIRRREWHLRTTRRRSCSGGHEGGQDVVGMPLQVRAAWSGGAWVGVAGSDLDVAQVDTGLEHGGDEGVAQRVQVHAGQVDAGALGEPAQASGGAVPVHPYPAAVEQEPRAGDRRRRGQGRDRPPGTAGPGRPCCPCPRTWSTRCTCSSPRSTTLRAPRNLGMTYMVVLAGDRR
jgi:hypothetical protein